MPGEDGGRGRVGHEHADAVLLVDEEVEVALGADLNGVDLPLVCDGAEACEGELLWASGGQILGVQCGNESAEKQAGKAEDQTAARAGEER